MECNYIFMETLNMLSCFKDYKKFIHILDRILDLAWPKYMKLSLEQKYVLSVLYSKYHARWCSGDFKIQCISRHDIDPQSWNIPSPASEELKLIPGMFYRILNEDTTVVIHSRFTVTWLLSGCLISGTPLTKILWAHNPNLGKISVALK